MGRGHLEEQCDRLKEDGSQRACVVSAVGQTCFLSRGSSWCPENPGTLPDPSSQGMWQAAVELMEFSPQAAVKG